MGSAFIICMILDKISKAKQTSNKTTNDRFNIKRVRNNDDLNVEQGTPSAQTIPGGRKNKLIINEN